MGRPRAFDWDEAKRLRDSGVPVREIAARFGVSTTSIYNATDAAVRDRAYARVLAWQRDGRCSHCGAPCTRGYERCMDCAARARTNVLGGDAYCPTCDAWKPLDAFSPSHRSKHRGVRVECRACDTVRRRRSRQQGKVSCAKSRISYANGCRCGDCREAHRVYMKQRRDEAAA